MSLGKLLLRSCFPRPIAIVGVGRSGTSVLMRALGRHPAVLGASGEAPLLARIGELLYQLDVEDLSDYYEKSLRIAKASLYETLRCLCFESVLGPRLGLVPGVRLLARSIIVPHKASWKKRFWCAKTFPTYSGSQGLEQLYPEIRYLYIIRDGISVVHSRTKYPGFRGQSFRHHCQQWAEGVSTYRYLTETQHALSVRHEELLADPEGFFKRVFSFLGLSFHPAPVQLVQGKLVSPLDQETQSDVDVKRIMAARRPAYEEWSAEQRETFRVVCGAAMAETGYPIPF